MVWKGLCSLVERINIRMNYEGLGYHSELVERV